MKRTLLILLIASLGISLSAQEDTLSWKQTFQRHDIQIGIGDPLLPALVSGNLTSLSSNSSHKRTASDWFSPDTYGWKFCTPSISISYKYRFAKWFWFGGTISYTGFYKKKYDRVTSEKAPSQMDHIITIMPSVRFSWLNKKYVTLYSGLSLGYRIDIMKYNENINADHGVGFQITAVGVHVGRKWYGFTEIGFGFQGFIQAGFGYNFNSKKK